MRDRTTRVILAYLVATLATAVVARADCPSLKQRATQKYEDKVESESIERNGAIGELEAGIALLDEDLQAVAADGIGARLADDIRDAIKGERAKLDKEHMEFRHWREAEALSHRQRLDEIDLEIAVSETAGLCLSMDELLRRCDVHTRHRRETEELRHRQAVDETRLRQISLSVPLLNVRIDDRHTLQKENQEHTDKLAMIELTCTQQKEIIRARHGQCAYSEMKLQYVHEWQRMQLQHPGKMQLARLQHESDLLRLELQHEGDLLSLENDPYLVDTAAIAEREKLRYRDTVALEKLRYGHTVALKTLRHEHDLKRSDPDLRWKVTSGRLDAGTLWMLKKANAQRQREEEILRHRQALEELEASRLEYLSDRSALAYAQVELARENALHGRTLRRIDAICPPRDASDCGCSH